MNTSYDTLTITINADSKQANSSIKALSTNLQRLEELAQNLDTKAIISLKKLLQDIAKIDFSNVSKGLQDVVSAFKAFNNKAYQKAVGGLSGETYTKKGQEESYTPNWEMKSWAYSNDTSLTIYKEMKAELGGLVGVFNEASFAGKTFQQTIEGLEKQLPVLYRDLNRVRTETITLEEALRNAGFNSQQIGVILSAINRDLKTIDPKQLGVIKDILIKFGASAEQADRIVKDLAKNATRLGDGAKKGANGLQKLANQFKNIMKYRIIRKIIQEIYKALTEGIKNVASFDKTTQDTLDRLSAKFAYFKNSIGAILSPIIQIVAPILEMILTLLGEVNNEIAEFFASVNGQTVFAKAKDDVEAYNKELKKTQSLGIDELNVLQQDNSGGFEYANVDLTKGGTEGANALAEVISTVKDVFGEIITYAKQFVTEILPKIGSLLKPIFEVLSYINELIYSLLHDTGEGVNTSIEDVVSALTSVLKISKTIMTTMSPLQPLMTVVGIILNAINPVISSIAGVIEYIFTMLEPIFTLLGYISDIVNAVISVLATWLGSGLRAIISAIQSLVELLKTVGKTIKAVFEGDFEGIGKLWEEFGGKIRKIWAGIGNSIIRVINTLLGAVEDFVNWIIGGVATIASAFGADTSTWGVSFGRISEITYASGGFPEDGMFFANHNELVGKFSNGQTAVANNEQITEGIYQAVLQAMRESGGANGKISIQIDGHELAKIITNEQNNFGADLFVGGNLNYGK